MKGQDLVNAISCLSSTLDALNRTGNDGAKAIVTAKILELVGKL